MSLFGNYTKTDFFVKNLKSQVKGASTFLDLVPLIDGILQNKTISKIKQLLHNEIGMFRISYC